MIRLIITLLFSIVISSCNRPPRIGVVDPDEVASLKSTNWTFIQAKAHEDFSLEDEHNWEPVQTDDFDLQQESNWEEVQ